MSRDPRLDHELNELVQSLREIERHLRHAKIAVWAVVGALVLIALPPLMQFIWGVVLFIVIAVAALVLMVVLVGGGNRFADRVRAWRRQR